VTRILNAEPSKYSEEAKAILRSIGELDEFALTREQLLCRLNNYNVLIVRLGFQVDRDVMDASDSLKVIVTATTGLDHIDVSYAETREIEVLSLQGEKEFLRSVPATAEHTWALLLSLLRRIPQAYASVLQGQWNRDAFCGRDLKSKRLGIIGLGRIGEKVSRFGQAFEMEVGAYDPHPKSCPAGVQQFHSLEKLLGRSDVLTLHVPLVAETSGMIGREELSLLPADAVLINTSRGEIIDETALVDALTRGQLAGAALDVICGERDARSRQSSPLVQFALENSNLLITPHIGGVTAESMAETELFMANKLKAYLNQHKLCSAAC
jgi:D-3-phosphoglycerate dehydrogenase